MFFCSVQIENQPHSCAFLSKSVIFAILYQVGTMKIDDHINQTVDMVKLENQLLRSV